MPNDVYKGRYTLPDYQLDGFAGNLDVLKSQAYRTLVSQMLTTMAVAGDKPTGFLMRFSERREEIPMFDAPHYLENHGRYQTVFELTAVPIEQARSLLGSGL